MKIYLAGVMTGTSCDGADFALLETTLKGGKVVRETLRKTGSSPFPSSLRKRLLEAQKGKLSIAACAELEIDYSNWMAVFCHRMLPKNRSRTLISIHGQTVWHSPPKKTRGYTVQLLDASAVSAKTGCTTVCSFRQSDMSLGGQGAPLVPYYHWLRAHGAGLSGHMPFAIHNVGGIANLTVVTKNASGILAFDTGPGNALMDLAAAKATRGRARFDRGGKIARSALSKINWSKIEALVRHPYFKAKPPKSTGRELFNAKFLSRLGGNGAVLVANATALTAWSMADAYAKHVFSKTGPLKTIWIAGGGAENPTLITLFKSALYQMTKTRPQIAPLPISFAPPQSLEAMAFARLGLEGILGNPVSLSNVTGAKRNAEGPAIFPGLNYKTLIRSLF